MCAQTLRDSSGMCVRENMGQALQIASKKRLTEEGETLLNRKTS